MTLKQHWYYWKTVGKYRHPLYKIYLYWSDRFKAWWESKAFERAKKLAIERHRATGETIYVLEDDEGKPRAFSTKEIKLLKRHGMMSRKATCLDLYNESMFIANYINCKNMKG
jgi:hypothetical protein